MTGVREWYALEPGRAPGAPKGSVARTWTDILQHWNLLELDLDDRGHDVESGILHQRSYRWLQLRGTDIARTPGTRLYAALTEGT